MTPSAIAIVGAGTMGGGIAIGCLAAGRATTVIDTTEAAGARLRARLVAKERPSAPEAAAAQARLIAPACTRYGAAQPARGLDLVFAG